MSFTEGKDADFMSNDVDFQEESTVLTPAMRTLDDATAIIATDDIRFEYVPCPEWGGKVRVRSITSKKRAELEKRLTEDKRTRQGITKEVNMQLFREWLVVYGCVKENGEPLFQSEHVKMLQDKSAGVIQRLTDAIMRLSGIGKDDVDELTDELRERPSSASSTK